MKKIMRGKQDNEMTPVFVTGAFSLSSADFLVPLIAQHPLFRVLVLPPLEFLTSQDFLERADECLQRGYLALRTPLGLERLSIFRSRPEDSVEAVRSWYFRGVAELKNAGLTLAEHTWRENGENLIDLYSQQLRNHAIPLQPKDIAVSWLRAIYKLAGCVADVQAHNGIIQLPLVFENYPEDFLFINELIKISQRTGLMNISGRGALFYRYSQSTPWIQVQKFHTIEDEQVVIIPVKHSGKPIKLKINPNSIQLVDFFDHPSIQLRALGSLRLVHLASFGKLAHIPWYNKSLKSRKTVAWQTVARVFVAPHAPKSISTSRLSRKASGSYLWDCAPPESHAHHNLVAVASTILGRIDNGELPFLTDIAQGLRGERARNSPYSHARGYLQINWRMLNEWAIARNIRSIPTNQWLLVDCLLFAVSIWVTLKQVRKQLQLEEKMELGDLNSLISANPPVTIQAFVRQAQLCGHMFGYPESLTQFSLAQVTEPEKLDHVSLTRITRGWFEIASGLTVTFWNFCNSVLSSDVTLAVILSRPLDFQKHQLHEIARDENLTITRR